eukprot:g5682.t1
MVKVEEAKNETSSTSPKGKEEKPDVTACAPSVLPGTEEWRSWKPKKIRGSAQESIRHTETAIVKAKEAEVVALQSIEQSEKGNYEKAAELAAEAKKLTLESQNAAQAAEKVSRQFGNPETKKPAERKPEKEKGSGEEKKDEKKKEKEGEEKTEEKKSEVVKEEKKEEEKVKTEQV